MDKSALLSAISRDELSLDWYKLPLICATALVVIGLVLEYWPEFERFDIRQYNPDLVKTLVGGIIVTAAIGGEVLLTFFAQGAETALRTDNKSYVSLIEKEASDAERETEVLRATNLELEKAISPRTLEQSVSANILSRFAGIPFVVISPADFEPKRTAGQIRFTLLQAKWVRFTEPLDLGEFKFFDGVTIHVVGIPNSDDPAQRAADTLVSVLENNGIVAREGFPSLRNDKQGRPLMPKFPFSLNPPNVIVVEVGPKPLPESLKMPPPSGGGIWGNIAE